MKRLLSWVLWALVAVCILVGVACIAWLESPMQVVLPLQLIVLTMGGVLLVLAGVLRRLRRHSRKVMVVTFAGVLFLGIAAVQMLNAPGCRDFTVQNGSIQLAGSACLPSTDSPVPTAIFVHGSGSETRSEYEFYAETLARSGVAAVIYDKRGSGSSTGRTYEVGYDGYAGDLVAVADWVRKQAYSDDSEIGFIGYSEAEWVMPLAAERFPATFIIVVGASGLSPMNQVSEEIEIRLKARGFDDAAVRAAVETNRQLGKYIRGDISADAFRDILEAAKSQPWFEPASDLPDEVYDRQEYAWWARVMDFDPAVAWRQYRGPVLFLKGTADDRSYADRSAERMRRMLEGPERELTIRFFEGADHTLLLWPMGDHIPPPRFADGYPAILGDWISERTSPGEAGD